MNRPIRLELVPRFEALPIDREAWNELVSRSETSSVFQTYEWFCSWCQIFGAQNDLWLILAFAGEALVGIVPLARKDGKIRFASERHADYCDVIAAEHKRDVIRAALKLLAERQADWGSIALHNIPERSSTMSHLKELSQEAGLRLLIRGSVACPTVVFGHIPGGAQTLLRKDSLQRPHSHFARSGPLSFRNISDPNEAQALLPHFFQQHIDRWRGARHRSLFLDADNQRFYQELVRQMLPTGRLVFSVVEHHQQPIAFHIGFNYANTFLWYKPSFDFRLHKQSPGNVLLRFLLQQSMEQNKKEFDFTVGDEPFKRRYSNTVRYNTNILLTSRMRPYAAARLRLSVKQLIRYLSGGRL